jgi:hypothetical protein
MKKDFPLFESLEDWIEKRWETQAALGEELGVAANTVSQWVSGKSRIKPPIRKKMVALGYNGPFPEATRPVTNDDLQALGRDLVGVVGSSEKRLSKEIQTLGAILHRIQEQLGQPSGSPEARR